MLLSIQSNNFLILCIGITIVALFFAIYIIVDFLLNKKKRKKISIENVEDNESNDLSLNTEETFEIKYVDEDSELEKTKAKLELKEIKEKLLLEEENKQKNQNNDIVKDVELTEVNQIQGESFEITSLDESESSNLNDAKIVTSFKVKPNNQENLDTKEVSLKETNNIAVTSDEDKSKLPKSTIREDVKTIDERERLIREKLEKSFKIKSNENDIKKEVEYSVNIASYDEDEQSAIISYEELKNSTTFGYTDEEMNKYVDEQDAIISIEELEKLYKEALEINKEKEKALFEESKLQSVTVQDLSFNSNEKVFKNSPVISPIHGVTSESNTYNTSSESENITRLNDEIKKTNEFLRALKDLKKNLE